MQWNGLVEEVVSKVKMSKTAELTNRRRDFTREVETMEDKRCYRRRERCCAGDSSPVTVMGR